MWVGDVAERLVTRSSYNETWVLSAGLCFLPLFRFLVPLRVCCADSGHALELSPLLLLTLSGLARKQESFDSEWWNLAGRIHQKRRYLWALEEMGIGSERRSESGHLPCCALLLGQPPPAATSTTPLPTPHPASLDCLQPYLETHRGLRWDGAISRKCSGISFLEKKKRDLGMSCRIEGLGC